MGVAFFLLAMGLLVEMACLTFPWEEKRMFSSPLYSGRAGPGDPRILSQ